MKLRNLSIAALSMLALSVGFTSCDDDDDEWNWESEGSTIEMKQTRAFVLNEGAMNNNNAGITYFDWTTDQTYTNDLFMIQNKKALGDVGQDIIEDDGNIYVIMSGSKCIYKMNGVGVLQSTLSVSSDLGDPRYGVIDDDYLYVTCYGGYVAKIDTRTMSLVGKVQVGANPEYIIEENNKLYCTCSGWGADKRVAEIDLDSFNKASYYDVMSNPDRIIEVNDHIYVQGYGAAWDYPWGELNIKTGAFTQIGNCSAWAENDNLLFLAYSETDWSTYATTTTLSAYDTNKGEQNKSFFKNAPAELTSSSVYGISVNDENGDIYVMTTDFVNNGSIYHFDSTGSFVRKFASTGVNPRKIIFLD